MIKKNLPIIMIALLTVACSKDLQRQTSNQSSNVQPLKEVVSERSDAEKQTVYFDTNSSKLTSDATAILDKDIIPQIKNDRPAKITVEGHCDERGSVPYNHTLGKKRAEAVKSYLIKNGVDFAKIKTVTYGKSKPVDHGHDEDAWSKNRRAVTVSYQK